MKRRAGLGGSMRSVVGFLSQRGLHGDPLLTQDFQRRRLRGCRNLYKKDLLGHFGCVNAIEFSNNGGQWLVSGGDDRRVLLWHMEQAIHSRVKPIQLKGEHHSNIFCLAFNSGNTKVFSGGNDEQVILHDVESSETLDVFAHEDAVYGLSVSPVNDNIFASSSDDGRVLIWDIRESPHGEPFCLANYPSAFHSVMFNPVEPRLLATANSKEGVGLWDIRKPQSISFQALMTLTCTCGEFLQIQKQIWSPYKQPGCTGDLDGRIEDDSRCLYTHEEYISLVLNSGSGLSHDYANQSVQEDPRMMAFFDSLVRREIEGWSSDSDSDLSESTILQLHAGVSERSGYTDSESSASLPRSPPPTVDENADSAFHLGPLRVTTANSGASPPPPPACEEAASRQQRLSALRRYQDKRLLALSNESDSEENACEVELDTDLFPRPRSPSPEEESSSSSSSSSSEDEEELNERRTATRQRNTLRRRQKAPREERPAPPSKPASTYIGEDNYDYPQIKVDDLSSSPPSSPERSTSTLEIQPSRASPTSDIESVERKIYKAYKWLRYSYISYSSNKDGESSLVSGEADEGRAGTSHKDSPAPSSSKEACLGSTVGPRNQDLTPEGRSKDASKEGTSARNPSNGPGQEHSSHPWAEAPEDPSQDTNNGGSVEHSFETKKLNGKALSKALSSRAEEPPSPPVPKASGSTLSSGSGSCPRTQSDDSEERSLETICANHNNGRLHPRPPHPHNNGQNFGELEAVMCSSPGHSDTDHDSLSLTGTLLHKDCCGSEMACETPSAGTREDATGPPDTDSSRAVHGHSGLKRHRVELEDTDSENSSSEKKLKT
ncbi:DDB1- and CUL4-associated factor 5 isoform X4 [Callorhinus ursinus]|uniref:DDB1- and CUL4-associated factor 5 isoform X4 n=1 Tax=Callorhinus ursinus TaxID=34884 RepID=A0A3Q7NVK8_CALUR|nr:DDB1- and CUL4-associated factor 5 isoform X4 [Callorhinus ursinus]